MSPVSQQRRPLIAMAVLGLILANAWTGWQLLSARAECELAQQQLAACRAVADQIVELRDAPVRFEDQAQSGEAMAQLIESAAQQVALPSDRIVHIAPGEPRRVQDTVYQEQSTELELREVTLRQLIQLALAIPQLNPSISGPSLVLRPPPAAESADAQDELWNAQLILTSYIYAPKIASPP